MNIILAVLPTCLVFMAVLVAAAPLGASVEAGLVLQVMPYMMAHLFLARRKGVVPSPVMFAAGIAMDIISNGPLGFWALIYLFGVLIARQLPHGLTNSQSGRVSGLLLIVFALAAAQVGLASLFRLAWIDWHPVLAGTLMAGFVTLLIDLMWRERREETTFNVTARGGDGATHV
ncbi:MAG: hypothetical protein ACR2PI_19560 [Hyphomicrobiaceae bacterium]